MLREDDGRVGSESDVDEDSREAGFIRQRPETAPGFSANLRETVESQNSDDPTLQSISGSVEALPDFRACHLGRSRESPANVRGSRQKLCAGMFRLQLWKLYSKQTV